MNILELEKSPPHIFVHVLHTIEGERKDSSALHCLIELWALGGSQVRLGLLLLEVAAS